MTKTTISKIDKLERYGSFLNFSWDKNTPEFSTKNLFYGWNGTGKTTFSDLLSDLSKDGVVNLFDPKNQSNTKIKISLSDVTPITSFGKNVLNNKIKVFNKSFIEQNCKISDKLEYLLFLGNNVDDAVKKKKNKEKEIEDAKSEIKIINFDKIKSDFETWLDGKAKDVKKEFNLPIYGYQRDLNNDITNGLKTDIDNDEQYLLKKKSLSQSGKTKIDNIPSRLIINLNNLEILLNKEITVNVIDNLEKDGVLKKWVKEGYEYYKNHTQDKCHFCGASIPTGRINELNGYFNEVNTKLEQDLNDFINKLEPPVLKLPLKNQFFADIENDFDTNKTNLENSLQLYNTAKEKILANIDSKKLSPNEKFPILEKDKKNFTDAESEFIKDLTELNKTIDKHNEKVDNFDSERTKTEENCKNYYIKEKILSDYKIKKKEKEDAEDKNKKQQEIINDINEDIKLLDAKITSHDPTIINQNIHKIIGSNNFQISENLEKTGYILERKRNGEYEIATEVSDGEKTVISFAYFLSTLQENGVNINDYIIVIDDPISSLDSNYIHNILYVIEKDVIAKNPLQLFILTHNFYFFRKIKVKMTGMKDSVYIIDRNKDTSFISKAGKYIKTYNNEYMFLVEYLKKVYKKILKNEIDDDDCMEYGTNVINSIRRFLEIFLSFKYPDIVKGDGVNKLLDEFQKENPDYTDSIFLKFITNEFSHANITDVNLDLCLSSAPKLKELMQTFFKFVRYLDKNHCYALLKIKDE